MTDDWRDLAACSQVGDIDLFFPPTGVSARPAKRICNGDPNRDIPPCPIREQCLAWAFEMDDRWAVLGGMTARERAAAKREAA